MRSDAIFACLAIRQHYEDRVRGINGFSHRTLLFLMAHNNQRGQDVISFQSALFKYGFIKSAQKRVQALMALVKEDDLNEDELANVLNEANLLLMTSEEYAKDIENVSGT